MRVTEKCNISCEYCLWKSGVIYKKEHIITCIDKIFELLVQLKKQRVLFYFHGGEPTTHPHIIYILDYIRKKEHDTGIDTYLQFQTNLVCNVARLSEIMKRVDGLNISLHLKELLQTKTLTTFRRNFDWLVENQHEILNFDVMLEYNIDNMFRYLRTVLRFLKYEKIVISEMVYAYIDFEEEDERYNNQIRQAEYRLYEKLYQRHNKSAQLYQIDGKVYDTNELFLKKLNCNGMLCVAGIRQIVVNGDGNVFVCNTNMTNYLNNRNGEVFTNFVTDPAAVTKLRALSKMKHIRCKWDECSSDFYLS